MHHVDGAATAAPTSGVTPVPPDEVPALTAAQFAMPAQIYRAITAHAAAAHQSFVRTLGGSAASYAAAEAANALAAG